MSIQNVLLWLEYRHGSTSLVNTIANNVLFHSDSHISQTLPQIIYITHILRCCLVVLLPHLL